MTRREHLATLLAGAALCAGPRPASAETAGAWVKLTGAYILSKVGPPTYADRGRLARAYVQLAPERLVWGSDWPHPAAPADAKPDDAVLLDRLADWAPDEALRNRILAANPVQLYGFG